MATIACIVVNPASLLDKFEQQFYDRLETTLGHTVTKIDDDDAETTDFSSYDAIVICSPVNALLVDGLKTTAKPLLFMKRQLVYYYELGTGFDTFTDDEINIVDNTHYITSLQSTGNLVVYSGAATITVGSGWSNDVNDLAQNPSDATESPLLEIDIDETLVDSSTAAERRVFLGTERGDILTSDGWEMFDRSVGWCLYEDAAGEAYTKNLTETLTITDTLSRDTVKVLTESMTITGVVYAAIGEYFTLNLTETLTITDTLHKILYDLSVFDPVTVVQVILYSNWNETTVDRPTIRSFVKREVEQGIIKRWNYLLNGDLIGISEIGFEKTPHSAGYDYTTTVIKLKLNVGTAKGRTHLFAVFDELRRSLHEKRGAPTSAYTSWRPLIVTNRTIHYDKYKRLWKMDVFVELREKCYALA